MTRRSDRERHEQADQQRSEQRALERTEPADHHHHEHQRPEIDPHVGPGGEERAGNGAGEAGEAGTDREHAHEDDWQVVA